MKNKVTLLLSGVLMATAFFAFGSVAHAETTSGKADWDVNFTEDNEMESNFKTGTTDDVISNLQPGDYAEFTVTLGNQNESTTDWYMTNDIIKTLEEDSNTAKSGAYSYRLVYVNPQGTEDVLYDSEKIGGLQVATAGGYADRSNAVGLHEATDNLDEFFYLDTLTKGQKAKVKLIVGLDGETQGNDYQDTLAQLKMNFAVELATGGPTREIRYKNREEYVIRKIVKTGDETSFGALYAVTFGLGVVCIFTGVMGIRARKKEANS